MGANYSKTNHVKSLPNNVEYPGYIHFDHQVKDPKQLACFAVIHEQSSRMFTVEQDTAFFVDWTAKYYLNDVAFIMVFDTPKEIEEKLDIARKIIKEKQSIHI